MNLRFIHIGWVIATTFMLFCSCKKEEIIASSISPNSVSIYPDANIGMSIGAVSGNGVVLLVYADVLGQYQFKLTNNDGNELWVKNFGYTYNVLNTQYPQIKVLYDVDETFAIFNGNALKKVNMQGDIVFNDTSFLKGTDLSSATISDIMLGNNNNYLIMGGAYISGNRAFVSEYSRSGQPVFFKLYTVNVNSTTLYSSGFKNDIGGYTIAGSFTSNTNGLKSAFFISTIDATGNIVKTTQTEVDSLKCVGKELISLQNGNLLYLLSPVDINSVDLRSRLYELNPKGEVVGVNYLDLASQNFGAGGSPYFGKGLVQNIDGTFIGLIKTGSEVKTNSFNTDIKVTYGQPHYSYYYALDMNANLSSQSYFNNNYSNYYNAAVRLSNGKTLLFGTTLSLGEEMKLITFVL